MVYNRKKAKRDVKNDNISNIYGESIKQEKKLNKRKIALLILMIIVLIGLILIVKNSISIIDSHSVYKQYETQLEVLKNEEQYKKAIEELGGVE